MFVVCLGFFWKRSVFPAIILSFKTAVFSIGLIYIYRIIKTKKSEQNTLPPYIYESFSVSTVIINSSECLNSKHAACYDIHKRLKCHFEGNHKKHVVVTSFWKTIIGFFFFFMFLVFSCFFFFLFWRLMKSYATCPFTSSAKSFQLWDLSPPLLFSPKITSFKASQI